MPNVAQTLDGRYIDGSKLLALLKRLFGTGRFTMNVSQIFHSVSYFTLLSLHCFALLAPRCSFFLLDDERNLADMLTHI